MSINGPNFQIICGANTQGNVTYRLARFLSENGRMGLGAPLIGPIDLSRFFFFMRSARGLCEETHDVRVRSVSVYEVVHEGICNRWRV